MTASEPSIERPGTPGATAPDDADDDSTPRRRGIGTPRAWSRGWQLHRVLELVAVALIPLGAGLVLLGWFGAANTVLIEEQVPYLISGGLLGIGLLIGGGVLYVGTWIARLAAQNREQADALRTAIEDLRDDVRSQGARTDDVPPGTVTAGSATAGSTAVAPSENGSAPRYVATPSGTMFHRLDCGVVTRRDDLEEVDAADTDLEPCGMCEPLAGRTGGEDG